MARCGGCGKGIPRRDRFCGKCAKAGATRRTGTVSPNLEAPKAKQVHVCGRRLASGATCHRSVVGTQACDNPGH